MRFDRQDMIVVRIWAAVLVCALLCVFAFSACKSVGCVPQVEYVRHDSVIVREKLDSVYVLEKDSVFIDKTAGDTIWATRLKEVVREHISVRVDTLWQTKEHEIIKTEYVRYVPRYYHWCSWAVWILVVIGLVRLAWWLIKKYYWVVGR